MGEQPVIDVVLEPAVEPDGDGPSLPPPGQVEVRDTTAILDGNAGASAQREYQRRKDRREQKVRAAHPKLGGLILAVTDDPQSTRAWAVGAVGETQIGKRLSALTEKGCHVLHDRRIPGSRANIDHIVVSSSGVYLVDAKNYTGMVTIERRGGWRGPQTRTLRVGRRDCTALVEGMHKQRDVALNVLGGAGLEAPVFEILAFWQAEWPLFTGDTSCDGVFVEGPRSTIKIITRQGSLTPESTRTVAEVLRQRLPAS